MGLLKTLTFVHIIGDLQRVVVDIVVVVTGVAVVAAAASETKDLKS